MTAQHTPYTAKQRNFIPHEMDIFDANGNYVASVPGITSLDRATFIVKACNAHEAMREALKRALKVNVFENNGNDFCTGKTHTHDVCWVCEARTLLASLEEVAQ